MTSELELANLAPESRVNPSKISMWEQAFKARTHRPIFRGFSAESVVELADSPTDSVEVGRLFILNMFNILKPPESANGNRLTIAVARRRIGLFTELADSLKCTGLI